ncbi:hypothetical protein HG530_008512 [Fusarium avenaceum]|nr:hypothetical protein HG530_008512 [Fusarium avenaceum]
MEECQAGVNTIVSALLGHKVVGVIGLAFASRTSVVEQEAVSSPCAEDVCLAAAKLHTVATTLLGSARTIGHDLEVGVDPRTVIEDVSDEILGGVFGRPGQNFGLGRGGRLCGGLPGGRVCSDTHGESGDLGHRDIIWNDGSSDWDLLGSGGSLHNGNCDWVASLSHGLGGGVGEELGIGVALAGDSKCLCGELCDCGPTSDRLGLSWGDRYGRGWANTAGLCDCIGLDTGN